MLSFPHNSPLDRRRRRYATQLLRQKRGLSRWQAIQFGFRKRVASMGLIRALGATTLMMAGDVMSAMLGLVLKVTLVYPIVAISRLINYIKKTGKTADAEPST